jgi:hypothetical protein
MTPEAADSVPAYMFINRPMILPIGGLNVTIDPARLAQDGAGNGVLQRADIFVLRMIVDSWPGRPFYFSRTSGGYARELGFGNNILTQGLASKVFVPPASPSRDTVFVQGDGWFDIARTRALWNDVFKGHDALIKTGDWIDQPSIGIPYLYVATGIELAETMADSDPAGARTVLAKTRDVANAMRLDAAAASVEQMLPLIQDLSGDSPRALPLPPSPPATKTQTPPG